MRTTLFGSVVSPPVVFQRHDDAGLLGVRNAFFDGIDAPLEGIVVCVALQGRFRAFGLHQVIEGFDRSPAARVETHAGNPHLGTQVDAVLGVIDVLVAHGWIGIDKILVNRQHREIQPIDQRQALQLVHVGGRLFLHLAMQDFNAVKADPGGLINHFFAGILVAAKVPVGIGGDAQAGSARGCPGGSEGVHGRGRLLTAASDRAACCRQGRGFDCVTSGNAHAFSPSDGPASGISQSPSVVYVDYRRI